jgi:O-succinylbenzoate synthase
MIDASNIRMVEQPFAHDNFGANLELKKVMKSPLCLDESIKSLQDVENYRLNNGCDIVNIKI